MKNLFTDAVDSISTQDVESFLAVTLPEAQRPTEGPRIDFKEQIPADLSNDVAALSNSFGGLIFIGVKSDKTKNNVPISIPGVPLTHPDLGAKLTAKFLSEIRPRPSFQIGIYPLPGLASGILLVRVDEGAFPPYEYAQGASTKIPVRIHDSTRQATLREILEMVQKRANLAVGPEALTDLDLPEAKLTLGPAENNTITISTSVQRFVIKPYGKVAVRLDRSFEHGSMNLIKNAFDDSHLGNFWNRTVRGTSHTFDWYAKVNGFRYARSIEIRDDGTIIYLEHLNRNGKEGEPISEMAIAATRFLRFVRSLFESMGSVGIGAIRHEIAASSQLKFVNDIPSIVTGMRNSTQRHLSQVVSELDVSMSEDRWRFLADSFRVHWRELLEASLETADLTAWLSQLDSSIP